MSSHKQSEVKSFDILILSAVCGALFIAAASAVAAFTDIPAYIVGLIFLVVYCLLEVWLCLLARHTSAAEKNAAEASSLNSFMSEVVRSADFPAIITTRDGKIIWANNSMLRLCEAEKQSDLARLSLTAFVNKPMEDIITCPDPHGINVDINGRQFTTHPYLMETPERDYWMTLFDERTELEEALRCIDRESPAVTYVVIDNLEELAQFVKVSYRSAANEIENILREWTAGMGGMIKEYDREKYLILFPREKLAECVDDGFAVLDKVRAVNMGDSSMSVTVSMGISVCGETLEEREKDAAAALETALQRGGDQVALRTPNGNDFFGGRTKTRQKRTKVRSRVIAERLVELITDAGNIIIMGHKNPDFDSIGACVGLARLAMAYNPNVKIVVDTECSNFNVCTASLREEVREFDNIFIGGGEGLDLIRSDTLLIVADVNNLKIVESPEIAANAYRTVIVDHHRKTAEYDNEPEIAYIEPNASSTCELVSELLELALPGTDSTAFTRHEANIMLSGIMLDTKNFTRSTTERTFSAALHLQTNGASSEVARTFFFAELSGFVTESRLGSGVHLYRERIAITVSDGEGTPEDRIAASKTADTLLTVREVDAAFVLIFTGNTVIISARSNGKINVQLILEKIGGGGHFDAAGAQISSDTPRTVLESLKSAIDEYLDN
ncbi:MAG: DHH family phosphoesterase [Clostridia bacterium]|nr:DHH family phosphoesterase [Clostridia bacterium]